MVSIMTVTVGLTKGAPAQMMMSVPAQTNVEVAARSVQTVCSLDVLPPPLAPRSAAMALTKTVTVNSMMAVTVINRVQPGNA